MSERPGNNKRHATLPETGQSYFMSHLCCKHPVWSHTSHLSAWDRKAHQTFSHKLKMEWFSFFMANRAAWAPKTKHFLLDPAIQNPARQQQRMKYPTPNSHVETQKPRTEMKTSLSDNNQLWVYKLEANISFSSSVFFKRTSLWSSGGRVLNCSYLHSPLHWQNSKIISVFQKDTLRLLWESQHFNWLQWAEDCNFTSKTAAILGSTDHPFSHLPKKLKSVQSSDTGEA